MREGYALPWGDDQNDTQRVALDVAAESRFIGVRQGDVFEGLLGDGEHVVCAVQSTADFTGNLLGRPGASSRITSSMVRR